ncbi:hypothetical protein [Streptomyces azureus]|uniref:Heme oxygenase n=1 Tax=Streptomyces azureus TaxID=146537 RepID=A0A0K8PGZ1_STRAJ|nr:hypothetical protein [Streptomyces azureus]GAP47165.1 heme oxygenase [Streptomyces azureus]
MATAHAGDDDPGHRNDKDHIPCSRYLGEIGTDTADLEWGGAVCHKGVFDI